MPCFPLACAVRRGDSPVVQEGSDAGEKGPVSYFALWVFGGISTGIAAQHAPELIGLSCAGFKVGFSVVACLPSEVAAAKPPGTSTSPLAARNVALG